MQNHNPFLEKLFRLQRRLNHAAEAAGRDPAKVRILPVTKNHPAEVIRWVAEAGIGAVGENRVQEAAGKQDVLGPVAVNRGVGADGKGETLRWELIGHLQSNKAALAVERFDVIQSVDSLKLLERLERIAMERGVIREILIQFNAGRDPGKFGFDPDVETVAAVATGLRGLEALRPIGLMTIAPLEGGLESARESFRTLRILRDRLRDAGIGGLDELSMGMSGDLEVAIEEGSTQIRVGTFLFGERA